MVIQHLTQLLDGQGRFLGFRVLGFRVRVPKARKLGQLAPINPNPVSKNTHLAPHQFCNFSATGRGRFGAILGAFGAI